MNLKEKREDLMGYFRQTLLDQTEAHKDAEEGQKKMLEQLIEKTRFLLILIEEGSTVFNGEKVELSDTKIEMMYRNYFGDPS